MTRIISSQRYINETIFTEKLAALVENGTTSITLEAWDVDGEIAVLFNGHHTLEAARELGIAVEFTVVSHPEGLTGDNLLEQAWMDSDWYDVETGKLVW